MAIFNQDGNIKKEISKLYLQDGGVKKQIGKVYNFDGTTKQLIYSSELILLNYASGNWTVTQTTNGNVRHDETGLFSEWRGDWDDDVVWTSELVDFAGFTNLNVTGFYRYGAAAFRATAAICDENKQELYSVVLHEYGGGTSDTKNYDYNKDLQFAGVRQKGYVVIKIKHGAYYSGSGSIIRTAKLT